MCMHCLGKSFIAPVSLVTMKDLFAPVAWQGWLVAFTGIAALVVGCSSSDENVSSDDAALLDVAVTRGTSTQKFQVAGRPDELCVVPQHIVGADYDKDDSKSETELCSYNFYGAEPGKGVAVCPKLTSTNPGVDVMELVEGKDAAATQAEVCKLVDRPNRMLAKYKQSMTCSYSPAILGYYHLSRALGGIGSVKPAVVRTMDLEQHKKVTAAGVSFTKDLLQTLWKQYQSSEANPAASRYRDALYTTDLKQIYGAMQENPRGETKYVDPITGRSINVRGATDYSSSFRATAAYQAMLDARPIKQWVPTTFAGSAQRITQMRDIADMVLIDTLLSQQDRFGNIHAVDYYYYQEDGATKKIKKSKVDDGEKPKPEGAVVVREMLLKDNDCGVIKDNVAKKAGMLGQIRHMSPKTYKHLRWLSANFGVGTEIPKFMSREALFTQADINTLRKNLAEAEASMVSRCRSGQLLLDLDIGSHLSTTIPAPAVNACDAIEAPKPE